jgi:hypothetical protein
MSFFLFDCLLATQYGQISFGKIFYFLFCNLSIKTIDIASNRRIFSLKAKIHGIKLREDSKKIKYDTQRLNVQHTIFSKKRRLHIKAEISYTNLIQVE